MSETKKLTESAVLSALFIVSTILAVGIGFGYALYLDFIVPVFFCMICLKCNLKYSVLSGITSTIIIALVLGNIGTAIWASQSIILGIMCGYLISKNTQIVDDMIYGSIIGIILMVFIDIYASKLIGYSFMKEFQGYVKMIPDRTFSMIIYYMFITTFSMGTVFSIYVLSIMLCGRLRISQDNLKKKFTIIKNFRFCSRFLCCSKKLFYIISSYLIIINIGKLFNIELKTVYLQTIIISIEYLCYYFVIRDGYVAIQNYILSKYEKVSYARILSLVILFSLVFIFKITIVVIITLNIILDIKINIRDKQINIVDSYIWSVLK